MPCRQDRIRVSRRRIIRLSDGQRVPRSVRHHQRSFLAERIQSQGQSTLVRPWVSSLCSRSFCDFVDLQDDMLDGFLPSKYLSYPIQALSGGTRKKLFVRQANIGHPAVLFLDECTTGVDPIAAQRIVAYLKALDQQNIQQGRLFASHRIDESIDVCSQVLMLVDGQVYFHAPITIFEALVCNYYQVDVVLVETRWNQTDLFLRELSALVGGRQCIERVVVYTQRQLRLTFHKEIVKVSTLWAALLQWADHGRYQRKAVVTIEKYSFRAMDMEEILSTIIAALSDDEPNKSIEGQR